MPYGKNLNEVLFRAVEYPVVVMVTENLAKFGTVDFGECFAAELRVVGEHQGDIASISVELDCVVEIEVVGNVIESRLKPLEAALGPKQSHTAARFGCFATCLAM